MTLTGLANEALAGRLETEEFEVGLQELQQNAFLRPEEIRPIVAAALQKQGELFLEDGLLSEDEADRLSSIQEAAGITAAAMGMREFLLLSAQYGFSRWEYAEALRDRFFPGPDRQMRQIMSETQMGILSHDADDDAITIWRDRANSKPEVFRGGAGYGWYMANVIANIELLDRPD